MKPECRACRFFESGDPTGHCHRRAPFAPVSSNEWCGEFERAINYEAVVEVSRNAGRQLYERGAPGVSLGAGSDPGETPQQ